VTGPGGAQVSTPVEEWTGDPPARHSVRHSGDSEIRLEDLESDPGSVGVPPAKGGGHDISGGGDVAEVRANGAAGSWGDDHVAGIFAHNVHKEEDESDDDFWEASAETVGELGAKMAASQRDMQLQVRSCACWAGMTTP
jgi:hypothetical protein